MKTGGCLRCGAFGPVEEDHPDGRCQGVPIFPVVVDPLCQPCHWLKGVYDRAANVEGGPATIRLVLARRSTWLEFLASDADLVVLPRRVVQDLAGVLMEAAVRVPEDLSIRSYCDE